MHASVCKAMDPGELDKSVPYHSSANFIVHTLAASGARLPSSVATVWHLKHEEAMCL